MAKCNIRLNGRKQISLYYGNSTPFVLEGKVITPPYVIPTKGIKETANYLGISLNDVKHSIENVFSCKQFFDRAKCGSIADTNNKKLGDFLTKCNNVIYLYPNKFKNAKEIATFVLNGCKEESLNPTITFADFLDIVINDQNGKEENPESANFKVYITLRNSLKDWEKFNSIISDLHQSDYNDLSTYLKNRKGKNGKKGANWERMMQCYRAVINAAISDNYNKITGCNDTNFITLDKQNKKTQFKQRSNKTYIELYNERQLEGALTFAQVEAFKKIDPTTLCIKVPSTDRNNKKRFNNLDVEKVSLCYDILSFMLYVGGIRPIDAIRIRHDNFDFEHNQIVYLPAKKKRFANDDGELIKHLVSVPLNNDITGLFEKYKSADANGFLFPCFCNIENNGKYNYKRINQFEGYMNRVIQSIGDILGLDFKPTCYTMRKTAITHNVDIEIEKAKIIAFEKVAKTAGTNPNLLPTTYYKQVNR